MKVHSLLCKRADESSESTESMKSVEMTQPIGLCALAMAASLAECSETSAPKLIAPVVQSTPNLKPKRKRASPAQVAVLKQFYGRTPFPDTECRQYLALKLGMTPRSVQIWFQNQRQHDKAVGIDRSRQNEWSTL